MTEKDKFGALFYGNELSRTDDCGKGLSGFITSFMVLFLISLMVKHFWIVLLLVVGIPLLWAISEIIIEKPTENFAKEKVNESVNHEINMRLPEEYYINQGFYHGDTHPEPLR